MGKSVRLFCHRHILATFGIITFIPMMSAHADTIDPRRKLETVPSLWRSAEQELSATTPFLSNIRNPIALVVPDASHHGSIPPQYKPESRKIFKPGVRLIPFEDALIVGTALPGPLLEKGPGDENFVKFFYHPSQSSFYSSLGMPTRGGYAATPSSSARSLFTSDGKNIFFSKTSLNGETMGGFPRQIPLDQGIRSVSNSRELQRLHDLTQGKLHNSGMRWDFFPETAAIFSKDPNVGGTIFRSIPSRFLEKNVVVLPMFSLVSRRKDEKTWIEVLYKDSEYTNRADFVFDKFVRPMTELFAVLGFKGGLTAQAHQQNLLVQVVKQKDGRFVIEGLGLRDTEALFPILSVNSKLGRKPVDPADLLKLNRMTRESVKHIDFEKDIFKYEISASKFVQGYAEDMRYNSVKSIFRSFLSGKEMDDVTIRMDSYFVEKYNEFMPNEYRISHIREFRNRFFEFDSDMLTKKGRQDILAIRRDRNPLPNVFLREYESWVTKLLDYRVRPSERDNLCTFVLKSLIKK